MAVFVSVREADNKGLTLKAAIAHGGPGARFDCRPSVFSMIEGSPFAYWVSDRLRSVFAELPAFGRNGRTAKQGIATSDDFRFVRLHWEADTANVASGWVPFVKGG